MRGKEDIPIRGPSWTDAAILRTSEGTSLREVKGLAALRKEFSGFCSQIKEGFEKEATSAPKATKSNSMDDSSSVNHHSQGAFDFLEDLEKEK